MKKWIILGSLLLLCFASIAFAAPAVEAERVEVPLERQGTAFELDAMLYKAFMSFCKKSAGSRTLACC